MLRAVTESTSRTWTRIYLRILSLILLYGALIHFANISSLSGRQWSEVPLSWQVMDVVLLLFNLVVAVGLWRRRSWAVYAFVLGMLFLQILPYTLFRELFVLNAEDAATLNGLILTDLLLVAILVLLILLKK